MITSNDIPLAAKPLDRAAHLRTDEAYLDAAIGSPDVLVFLMQEGLPFIQRASGMAGAKLVWLGPEAQTMFPDAERLFMGQDTRGNPIFALALAEGPGVGGTILDGTGKFEDMRAAAASLSALEANLVSTARSITEWHRSHGFCSKCGHASDVAEAGWKRVCPSCGTEHFPRTDPVAIMLPVRGEYCLLGRSPGWPEGFMSCLAGFVEPGETFEQAAAREVREEAGIECDVASGKYLFCQPWPFPSSLMVGIILEAQSEDITVDPKELEAARWFSRDEAKAILAGNHPDVFCPPEIAIAHHVLKVWANEEV